MGVQDEFDEMRRMINRMLEDAFQGKAGPHREPLVRGSLVRARPRDGEGPPRPYVVPVPAVPALPGPEITAGEREVYVTFDLGGGPTTNVRTRVMGRLLLVDVEGPRSLQRVVELPHDVEPEVRWTIRNGVLDLVLARPRRPPRLP